jgi:hypothetical protein
MSAFAATDLDSIVGVGSGRLGISKHPLLFWTRGDERVWRPASSPRYGEAFPSAIPVEGRGRFSRHGCDEIAVVGTKRRPLPPSSPWRKHFAPTIRVRDRHRLWPGSPAMNGAVRFHSGRSARWPVWNSQRRRNLLYAPKLHGRSLAYHDQMPAVRLRLQGDVRRKKCRRTVSSVGSFSPGIADKPPTPPHRAGSVDRNGHR